MAEFPAMPVFTDAYLADCSHLTDAEHGRYFLLMMELWRAPNSRIPNDDAWLARKFNRSPARVKKELRPIIEEFCKNSGNWITQKRVKKEKTFLRNRQKQQSERAKSRWNKDKDTCENDADPHQSGIAAPHRSGICPQLNSTQPHSTQQKNELNSIDDGLGKGMEGNGDNIKQLKPETYDNAKMAAPGFDVHFLEDEWRTWTRSTGQVIKNPDRAFVAFCREHAKRNPL